MKSLYKKLRILYEWARIAQDIYQVYWIFLFEGLALRYIVWPYLMIYLEGFLSKEELCAGLKPPHYWDIYFKSTLLADILHSSSQLVLKELAFLCDLFSFIQEVLSSSLNRGSQNMSLLRASLLLVRWAFVAWVNQSGDLKMFALRQLIQNVCPLTPDNYCSNNFMQNVLKQKIAFNGPNATCHSFCNVADEELNIFYK